MLGQSKAKNYASLMHTLKTMLVGIFFTTSPLLAQETVPLDRVLELFKARCTKCHGPAKSEAKLNLSTSSSIARGADGVPVVASHDLASSPLWDRIAKNEMPPDQPLKTDEKELIQRWIVAGAAGLTTVDHTNPADDHWSFRHLSLPAVPIPKKTAGLSNPVDYFLQVERESKPLQANPPADFHRLIRRVSLDLTGLPPTLEELDRFTTSIASPQARYEGMVEHYLSSEQYGVRWGKYWLDAAGYADSNGYFNADSDRPLAYRYRDYVVRCFNADRPFDRFVVEQLAGDELANFQTGQTVTPELIELLEATHYLRNGQDGSGESDGNPDEVRADRYYALESAMQNTATSLLGLTIQCAKCHDHKFEPITQRDFYQWQAVFYPTFNIEKWIKPNDRVLLAPLNAELESWEAQKSELESRVESLKMDLKRWVAQNRAVGEVLFEDSFAAPSIKDRWSATAPGDDSAGGTVVVSLDSDMAPAAKATGGQLQIIEGNTQGDSWISTVKSFDWTPNENGESIQVTFDLIDNRLKRDGTPAHRIGYLIALHDFNDNSSVKSGNLLIDGNPTAASALNLDYPGSDSQGIGNLGSTGYTPGHNYGVRITNQGKGKFRLEHLVDMVPEEPAIELKEVDLPDGGFGFEYCCGRSFVVDNVLVERIATASKEDAGAAEFKKRQDELKAAHAELKQVASNQPGKIAWATDMSAELPDVRLLLRGNITTPGDVVEHGTLSILDEPSNTYEKTKDVALKTSGRRLAWAKWLIAPDSRAASLLARVQVNRIWQHHFGTGLVATSENLGVSGATPSHPELLDWLASKLIENRWSLKSIHRLILNSAAYRQSSDFSKESFEADSSNRLIWRYPMRRLDAEAIRDSMLSVSGDIDSKLGGPYIATTRNESGEVVAPETDPNAFRRSLFVNHKRTQVLSFLSIFDTPSIVFNSVRRNSSTMPLQSLALLNSEFAVRRSQSTAKRLQTIEPNEECRIELAFRMFYARPPSASELADTNRFLQEQVEQYRELPEPKLRAWQDLCQACFASSEFIYIE
jgi:Protein of unknown function (DUF1553)/Protein of unknown function (DUF1549)/Planctomycete cytochrome C